MPGNSHDETKPLSEAPVGEIPPGLTRLGQYELLKELGRGAQGVVYLARHVQLGREVALKVLAGAAAQSSSVRERFQREAEIASKLDHPGICAVHEIGEEQGIPYIAMQYVRGTTLADMVEESSTQLSAEGKTGSRSVHIETSQSSVSQQGDMQDVVWLIERTARALHAAHEKGLVHRDIKPGNIMVTPENDPVLLDFGLARAVDSEGQTLTQSGQIMGTPAYLAPEQIRADRDAIDRRTDVYGLGVTLFECLTLERPFDADTFEQLFQSILNDLPPNPRKLNPRIPQDLRTVIDTAMERDPRRRYQTAQAFAEDLRRVRSFEPILAKAAGPVVRATKWVRRHPAAASAIAAAAILVIVGAGFLITQSLERAAAVRQHLAEAEQRLAAGDFSRALESVAQAREREPDSPLVLELRTRIAREQELAQREAQRRADLAKAGQARDDFRAKLADFDRARVELAPLAEALERDRAAVEQGFATDEARGAFAAKEREWQRRQVEPDRLLFQAREALQRAARLEAPWGGSSLATETAFASFYMREWRDAIAARDATRAEFLRKAVEEHDPEGRFADELLGRGTVALAVTPADAEVFLFRYQSIETVTDENVVPRLVPVPTTGIGRVATPPDLAPGDMCLRIAAVEPNAVAAQNGLRPGDLVLRIGGHPAGRGLFAIDDEAEDTTNASLRVIESINGTPVHDWFDWSFAPRNEREKVDTVLLAGIEEPLLRERGSLRPRDSLQLVHEPAPIPLRLSCLRGDTPLELTIPEGGAAGLRCEVTAYPLVCGADNRIVPGEAFEVDPGSYLAVARAEGFEEQRFPFVVPRGGEAMPEIELLPAGSTPAGFVHVPAGPFRFGGDPDAFNGLPEEEIDVPGFFIGRIEVTNAEWFEFVNDPETRKRIDEAAARSTVIYLPRHDDGNVFYRKLPGGRYAHWTGYGSTSRTPVGGVSWNDVHDYLAWRNRGAESRGEPWVYDLPTEQQWEKAARGADARAFPWGHRFDFSLTVGFHRKWKYLIGMPGGFEPRDESPFGVLDLAGSREEWLRDLHKDGADGARSYFKRGASFLAAKPSSFRSARRNYAHEDNPPSTVGFRLVARRRP